MHVVSLNIGTPQVMTRGDRAIATSINRRPVAGPLELTTLGFEGDREANQRVHGGPDRAICCYPHEHYPHWRERLKAPLEVPAFGENLTTEGLLESEVCLGDVFRIGGATVQISQPRQPCGTLAMRNDAPDLPTWINERAFSGFYLRVIETGRMAPGDGISLIERRHADVTIAFLLRAKLDKQSPRERLEYLAGLPALSTGWRQTFQERIAESQ